jgi:hypothetical protein
MSNSPQTIFSRSAGSAVGAFSSGLQGQTEVKEPPRQKVFKGHRDIAEIASHHFKKASIPIKMYLKSLAILEKASNYLKNSSKIIKIFIKALHF